MAEVTTVELARFLNIDQAKIRVLEGRGVIKKAKHNAWDPVKCAAAYIRYMQDEMKKTGKNSPDETVLTQPQAAALLGVTTRRIRQRSQEEDPPLQDKNGQYPCKEFGKWMLNDFRRGLGIAKDGTGYYDYDGERARLTFHQANNAEMEEQRKRRELIPANDIRQAWSDIISSARLKMLSLPTRIASVCSGKPASEIEKEAREIVNEALIELSEGGDGVPDDS
ncbi:hypothetical protein [Prosthecochloris sp.]|uniref:hypothetical protein n=1 Tax=Prosthecochloris sp. TaxID=290513 RepID=UPI0025F6BA21|nr:hypothetical protein [Prosthecochloris sp.]